MPEQRPTLRTTNTELTDFTMHQLTVFRAVAQYLSYTQAAHALYLSQPAVTQQIKGLEQMLALKLFVRQGRGIVLTPAGQELLQHVERLLAVLAETAPVVHEIHALERGSVVVGASTSAGTYVVPAFLGAFHVQHPGIRITLTVGNRRTIEEYLLTRQVDLVVMSLIEHQDRFVIELLMPYELVMVAPPNHRLVGRVSLSLNEAQEEIFLMREQGAGTRINAEQYFAQINMPLRSSLELGSIEAIKEGVAAGLGIAVLSRESVALEVANGDLAILDVEGFPLKREWYVVHLKGRRLSRAAAAFQQFLLQTSTNGEETN